MRTILFVLSLLMTQLSYADVQVMLKSDRPGKALISSNGAAVLVQEQGSSTRMLLDLQQKKISILNDAKKQVMQFDFANDTQSVAGPGAEVQLKATGKSETLAGYPSRQYQIHTAMASCGSVFAAKAALNNNELNQLLQALMVMQRQSTLMMSKIGRSPIAHDPCKLAQRDLSEPFRQIGLPMRIIDEQGHLKAEVVEIRGNQKLPAQMFSVPADYNTTLLQQVQQQLINNMPDMNQVFQQMQQYQQHLPPELLQQLKQLQAPPTQAP